MDNQQDLIVKPPVHLLLAAVIVGGLFYLVGQYIASQPQRVAQETEAKREISVQGRGEVHGKPDVARLTLGLDTGIQPTAQAAMELLSRKFDGIVAAVRGSGVKEEDIKATNLTIQPQYDFPDGRQTLRGFQASESIEVTIRDLSSIGNVLAATTQQGANQAGGLTFEIDDPKALQKEATKKAIEDAKENAEELAKTLGVGLGRVKAFTVSSEGPSEPPFFAEARLERAVGGAPGAPLPVPSGTHDIVVTVMVTYTLR